MSNRNLAFLILISFCATILGAIYYFFIANVGSITIDVGNIEGVKLSLNGEFKNTESITCNNKCGFSKKPPINYTLVVSKETYKTQNIDFKLNRSENKNIKLILEKDVQSDEIKLSKDEKLKALKYNKLIASKNEDSGDSAKRIIIGNYAGKIYSYSNKDNLFYIYESDGESENEIYSQKEIKLKKIGINIVDGIIFYNSQSDKYLFNIKLKSNFRLDITEDINFIKVTPLTSKYIVNTMNGIYLYDISNNSFTKNTLFDDFVVLNSGKILGVIYPASIEKLSILNFSDNKKTKIILHDISTISRKVIYETTSSIKYIFNEGGEIKYLDIDMNLFSLKQLEIN
ncbi:MAG: hypothetical protein PHZ26_04510 [Candidatus Gracilibacteria bacterium]|nr:hypothetical protein [Candidatus Gracilibacteria bacterium]MDD2908990.1 hypothetical protein [Candidatus Gracilibacteria bacterium]